MWQLSDCLAEWSGRETTYVAAGDVSVSYRQAHAAAAAGAARLPSAIRGSTVALLTTNSLAGVLCYWTLQLAGAVVLLLDPKGAEREFVTLVGACGCDWVACDAHGRDTAAVVARAAGLGLILAHDDHQVVLRPPRESRPNRHPAGIAVMCVTSGSTGAPKAVMLSHANLRANVDAHVASLMLGPADVTLVVLPLAFSYAHTSQFLTHTRMGGTLVLYDRLVFVPKRFCELIERSGATVTSLVPALLCILDRYPHLQRHDLSRLRYLCCGGAPLPLHAARSLMDKLPHVRLIHTYGLTEASPRVTTLGPQDDLEKLPSIGRPIPGVEVDIVDDAGQPAPAGEAGELVVRGPNVMVGYCGAPEETRAMLRDAWLRTGDLARRDESGYLFLVGRKKQVIVTGGSNVSPEEIERALLMHPAVTGAVVTSADDAALGEVPVAYVSLCEGAALSLQQLHEFLRGRLASWKWPARLFVRPALATTPTGKIRRDRVH